MNRIEALTSARFFAAISVVLYHYGIAPLGGGEAVTFFFVLSGYVLTLGYGNRKFSWSHAVRFWRGRAARLLPMHWLVLSAMVATYASIEWHLFWNALLLHAWLILNPWAMGYNLPAWSISAEAFFYALFPALVLISGSRLAILGLALATPILALHWLVAGEPLSVTDPLYYTPLARLPEFIFGMALAKIQLKLGIWAIFFGAALAVIGWHIPISTIHYSYGILPGVILTIAGLASTNRLTQLLSWRPLVVLGDASFALYMIHYPLMDAAKLEGIQPSWWLALIAVLMSIGLHRWFERPIYLWGK